VLTAILLACLVFLLLTAAAALGRFVRPRLPERHTTRETIEALQIIIGMLVTFTALVLGLLTASVKTAYDHAGHDLQAYSLDLTQLDRCLRDYGPETAQARDLLTAYTAALIAATWTSEPPPAGIAYPRGPGVPQVGPSTVLRDTLNQVYLDLLRLVPADPVHAAVRGDCLADFRTVLAGRMAAIEDDRPQIATPFDVILVVWLMIIFAMFGLVAPRNAISLIGLVLCGVSLSLAMFVMLSLSHPYFVAFSSQDMRDALAVMTAPGP
jgi:hypothetical protein